jgi:hypothetical protein
MTMKLQKKSIEFKMTYHYHLHNKKMLLAAARRACSL